MEQQEKQEQLIQIIKRGEKHASPLRFGMEFEHIVVRKDTLATVTYYEAQGIQEILLSLLEKGSSPVYEGDYLVGMEMAYGAITLEPGGQLELSIHPCSNIGETEELYSRFLEDLLPILEQNDQLLLAIGYHPKNKIAEIPFNPKKRYRFMSEYFKTTGKYAHNMMKGTASLQVAIDYRDETDFIKKLRVANYLVPVLALISDNSPVFEGEPAPCHSVRSLIWENTDPERSGILPGVMDQTFGYQAYADYLLQTAPIFIVQQGTYQGTGTETLDKLMDRLTFSQAELEHAFSMVFPDVRVKYYIEIRMGDALPVPLNMAYGALLYGIFYNQEGLDRLYQRSLSMNQQELTACKQNMIEQGFSALFHGRPIGEVAMELFAIAEAGLPEEERAYLEPLRALTAAGTNPAAHSKILLQQEGTPALVWCAQRQDKGRRAFVR